MIIENSFIMKKHVIRIMAILFILIVACQSFCYADIIWIDENELKKEKKEE